MVRLGTQPIDFAGPELQARRRNWFINERRAIMSCLKRVKKGKISHDM
jgi:hypothetical protein